MRGESTWFKMFRSRDGIEPVDEGNDLLPSDRSETVPTEVHWSTFGSLTVYIFHGRLNSFLFGAVTSVKKCLSSLFPSGHWRQFCSASTCWAPALGRSCARCTKTSHAWSLPSEAESLWARRQDGCLKYSSKFSRTDLIVWFRDPFAEILKIKWSY